MPSLTNINRDCSFGEKPKTCVKRDKQKWLKLQSHQLSCPNVSCINVTIKENDDCFKRVHSFNNIDIAQEHAKYDKNFKQQSVPLEKSNHQNLTGARRKTKSNKCTSKDSIIKRSKENRRCHSFNHKHLDLKSIFKGT